MKILNLKLTAVSLALSTFVFLSSDIFANPTGGAVVSGDASIATDGTTLTVTQTTPSAIVNWENFSIQQNELARFNQPSSTSVILNRVIGNGVDPGSIQRSDILGRLESNGRVFIVNPAGIFFGPNATVDVSALVASTASISNTDFLSGAYKFTDPGTGQGSIINQGSITAQTHGLVALLAPTVQNTGIITATQGSIVLGSGKAFTLDFFGDQLINFTIDKDADTSGSGVTNSGTLTSDGGKILVSARLAQNVVDNAINMSGVAQARSVSVRNGEIILGGGSHGVVRIAGKLDVSGKNAGEKGGNIKLSGHTVFADAGTILDLNGTLGNGFLFLSSTYLATDPSVTDAFFTEFNSSASRLVLLGLHALGNEVAPLAIPTGVAESNAWRDGVIHTAKTSENREVVIGELRILKRNIDSTTQAWGAGVDWAVAANVFSANLEPAINGLLSLLTPPTIVAPPVTIPPPPPPPSGPTVVETYINDGTSAAIAQILAAIGSDNEIIPGVSNADLAQAIIYATSRSDDPQLDAVLTAVNTGDFFNGQYQTNNIQQAVYALADGGTLPNFLTQALQASYPVPVGNFSVPPIDSSVSNTLRESGPIDAAILLRGLLNRPIPLSPFIPAALDPYYFGVGQTFNNVEPSFVQAIIGASIYQGPAELQAVMNAQGDAQIRTAVNALVTPTVVYQTPTWLQLPPH